MYVSVHVQVKGLKLHVGDGSGTFGNVQVRCKFVYLLMKQSTGWLQFQRLLLHVAPF